MFLRARRLPLSLLAVPRPPPPQPLEVSSTDNGAVFYFSIAGDLRDCFELPDAAGWLDCWASSLCATRRPPSEAPFAQAALMLPTLFRSRMKMTCPQSCNLMAPTSGNSTLAFPQRNAQHLFASSKWQNKVWQGLLFWVAMSVPTWTFSPNHAHLCL